MSRSTLRRYSPSAHRQERSAQSHAPSIHTLDGGIIAAVSILAGIGLVMIYSLTAPLSNESTIPSQFTRHVGALIASGVALIVALRMPLAVWRHLALPLWGVCVALLIATWFGGIEVNGAQRWLALPGFRLQAAEFAKFATLLAAAIALTSASERGRLRLRPIWVATLLCAAPVALLLMQPDFGSALVLCMSVGVLLFVTDVSLRSLISAATLALGGAGAYIALHPYALARWIGFLNPWATANHEGFQLVQSFVAFGRGGIFGVGLGSGRQKLYYLPEAHTDFILAGIAEELGLIGVLVVLGAFAAFVWAGTRIARRASDPFTSLVAIAMTTVIGIPAAINAAVVMGLLPTTGFTLPFVSFGGNSLLVCSLAVGILLRIGSCEAAPTRARASGASRRRIAHR